MTEEPFDDEISVAEENEELEGVSDTDDVRSQSDADNDTDDNLSDDDDAIDDLAEDLEDVDVDDEIKENAKPMKGVSKVVVTADLENSDDEDIEILEKLDLEGKENYLMDFHPEDLHHNQNEILALAVVKRDKDGRINDQNHRTYPVMTKYEKTRILGLRAKQLNSGMEPNISVTENMIDGYLIAVEELKANKIPFIIRRPLPNRQSEYWHVQDLQILY